MTPSTRYITQTYIQSSTVLYGYVLLKAQKELGLQDARAERTVKTLYGILESDLYLYPTYVSHHIDTLSMRSARADSCVMYRNKKRHLDSKIMLPVDDFLGLGSEPFL